MRKLSTLVAGLAALFATPAALAAEGSDAIRAMTYNIRLDLASDGTNAWPHRREMVAALIRHEDPDVIGMQEVLLRQKQDLEQALPGYAMVGDGRDGGDKGEFSPLAYRLDRFELIDSGTFWLSETPSVPGKGWDAAYPRIATWALLRDRSGGEVLRVINTHFDHVGRIARHQSAVMLSSWLAMGDWSNLPTILMGDLNSGPDEDGYRLLAKEATGLRDARLASSTPPYGPPGTFNGWKIDGNAAAPIDHIFLSGDWSASRYSVVTQHWGGRLPSDHYPVVVDLVRNRR